jgi:hypothetical protein
MGRLSPVGLDVRAGAGQPYPWTHKPGDTMEKVNITYLRSMIQVNAATALLADPEGASSDRK